MPFLGQRFARPAERVKISKHSPQSTDIPRPRTKPCATKVTNMTVLFDKYAEDATSRTKTVYDVSKDKYPARQKFL